MLGEKFAPKLSKCDKLSEAAICQTCLICCGACFRNIVCIGCSQAHKCNVYKPCEVDCEPCLQFWYVWSATACRHLKSGGVLPRCTCAWYRWTVHIPHALCLHFLFQYIEIYIAFVRETCYRYRHTSLLNLQQTAQKKHGRTLQQAEYSNLPHHTTLSSAALTS